MLAVLPSFVAAEPAAKRSFDISSADAVVSLKGFAEQSGQEIIYPPDVVKGTRTNEIKGEFTPKEANDGMLTETVLVPTQAKSGRTTGTRSNHPNGHRAAQQSQ